MARLYQPVGELSLPDLRFPIQKVDGSRWIVVGEVYAARQEGGDLLALDVHFDGDNPAHEFLGPNAWSGVAAARRLSEAYNRPHTRAFCLRLRRMTTYTADIGDAFDKAADAEDMLVSAQDRDARSP